MSTILKVLITFLLVATTLQTNIVLAQDSTLVVFKTTPLDSMLVYMEADDYLFSDTLWARHNQEIKLKSGLVIFTLMSNQYQDHKDFAILKPNDTRIVKLDSSKVFTPRYPNWSNSSLVGYARNVNLMILTEDESVVYINGKMVSKGSSLFKVPETERLKVKTMGPKGTRQTEVKIHSYQRFVGLDHFTYPTITSINKHKLLPGVYDFSRKNYLASAAQIGTFVGLGLVIRYQRNQNNLFQVRYNTAKQDYQTAQSEADAFEAYQRSESVRSQINKTIINQRLSVTGLIGLFGFNYLRINRLNKKNNYDPCTTDFLNLPKFEYDVSSGTYKATISTNF